jgi:hypothetical protein
MELQLFLSTKRCLTQGLQGRYGTEHTPGSAATATNPHMSLLLLLLDNLCVCRFREAGWQGVADELALDVNRLWLR